MELYRNDDVRVIVWFFCPSLPRQQIQKGKYLLRFEFPWCSVDGKHLMCFQSEGAVLIFSWLKPRPHYAGEIWKQSFISPVRPSVHSNPEKTETELFENAFENGGIWKRSNLKTREVENGWIWKRRNLKAEEFEKGGIWKWRNLKTEEFENGGIWKRSFAF